MSQKKNQAQGIGVCSAEVGSATIAMKAQRTLEQYKIQSSVSKTTTSRGCVYTINFLCMHRENAENILKSHGIRIRGYL